MVGCLHRTARGAVGTVVELILSQNVKSPGDFGSVECSMQSADNHLIAGSLCICSAIVRWRRVSERAFVCTRSVLCDPPSPPGVRGLGGMAATCAADS